MTADLELGRGPELGVEWYPGPGGWMVSTPVYAGKEQEARAAIICPHWEYKETKRETFREEETGRDWLIIIERCSQCVAQRFRQRPSTQEMFAQAPPVPPEGLCPIEKVFRFPTFVILVRRMQWNPHDPSSIQILSYVEAGGRAHSVIMPLTLSPFAGAALETVKDMRRILRMGPEQYVAYMVFMEKRKTAEEKSEKAGHAGTLLPVALAAGEPALAEAEAALTTLAQAEARKIAETFGDPRKAELLQELRELETESWEAETAIRTGRLGPAEKAQAGRLIAELEPRIQALRREIGM